MMYRLQIALILIVLSVTACGGTNRPTPTPLPTPALRASESHAEVSAQPVEATPVVAQTPTSTPDPTIEQVEIRTADNIILRAAFYHVMGATGPGPALLLLHSSYEDRGHWHEFAKQMQDAGYAVLVPNLRGHGDSDGVQDFVAIMETDTDRILAWLLSHPEIDRARVGVAGSSVGSILALRGAALYPEIRAVAMLSPGRNMWAFTTDDALEPYGDRPLLIMAARDDAYHAGSSEFLAEYAVGNAELYLFDGSSHGTDLLTDHIEVPTLLMQFFQNSL